MKFYLVALTLVAALAPLYTVALDAPKQFVRKEGDRTNLASTAATTTESNVNDFSAKVNRLLVSVSHSGRKLVDGQDTDVAVDCPVCNVAADAAAEEAKDEDPSSNTRPLQKVISRVKGLHTALSQDLPGSNSSTIDIVRASRDDILNVFAAAGKNWAALAAQTQSLKTATVVATSAPSATDSAANAVATVSADATLSSLLVATFDLLEDVTTTTADYFFQLTEALVAAELAFVTMEASLILSTLSLMERVSLGVVQVVANTLTAIAAQLQGEGAVAADAKQKDKEKEPADTEPETETETTALNLRKILKAGVENGVFGDVISLLAAQTDDASAIGQFTTILNNTATDMAGIADRLETFVDLANAVVGGGQDSDSTTGTAVSTVQANTINEILALITNLISTILNLIVSIITTLINLIVGIISSILNLILGIISAIIDLIVSILNAILGIFSAEVSADGIGMGAVGSLVAMKLMGLILENPQVPIGIATCALQLDSCPYPTEDELECRTAALACQNTALAETLPTVE